MESEWFLHHHLPAGSTWETPHNDYGIDVRIGIVRDGFVTGQELIAQLKSADEASTQAYERIRLRLSTYNYLMASVSVAMLVKYIAAEREAYWVLLRDVPHPDQARKSVTVRIPRGNRISALNWDDLLARITPIHELKLGAGRRGA
jgi:hypothetical protein